MRDRIDTLSDREKETLRLLLLGHDAKSIARHLGLSVHTVNERLRDARRKLAVSSSREAARLLAAADRADPDLFGDKELGVSADTLDMRDPGPADRRPDGPPRLAWFGGGMLIMSLIIAAAIVAATSHGNDAAKPTGAPSGAVAGGTTRVAQPAGLQSALDWLAVLDREQWSASWTQTSALFRAQVSETQWTSMVRPLRQSLGSVSGRSFAGATEASSAPALPTGQYETLQFQTRFARKADAIEIVSLARDASGWRVVGYYIR
jgi:DNA-binding CsgD family transcriptional regulator